MTWWRDATFYEIYIRSFQDSNGDGIGDLNGITARVDYLTELGVNGIWITPFYPSPQVDFGYDVSDHESVDPQFGTLSDFDRLVAAAHDRDIAVVIDIVLNHTSDRHPWFESSRASKDAPLRDWYIWRDGAAPGRPPNNWESAFGGSAWTFDERTAQWYYHSFYAEQPDLNWRNPRVEARMLDVLKFWIDHGVDGFRLDAVNTLFEDPALRDNPLLPQAKVTLTGVVTQDFVQSRRLPEVHAALRRVRGFVDRHAPDTVLISEAYVDEVGDLVRFYGDDDEMHLPFNFFAAQVPTLDAALFRRAIDEVDAACGERWPSLVLSNHDIERACDRYAGAEHADAVARVLAMLLLTLRGTPFLYYGEEIAMRTHPPARLEDVRDPVGRTFWPAYKGRDGVRRPMQWEDKPGGGFSTAAPWLALAPDVRTRNVAQQAEDPRSVLHFYRALLRARRASDALRAGRYRSLVSDPQVFAYVREGLHETMLVVLNMSSTARPAALAIQPPGTRRVVLGSHRTRGEALTMEGLQLHAFEALLLA
jgi:alpha-glucosidase